MHHRGAALKAAAGENDRIRGDRAGFAVLRNRQADDAIVCGDNLACVAPVPEPHAGVSGCTRQRRNNGRPPACRLNPRWPLGEVISRLDECDAV